ncbi:MAG: cellulose synthase subunit BcsC-related outer membrane protein [Roseococcus sp.]|nr:cellulose synthase subunit BcsC-related outer membrane protein [Roseococcus sp.]
MAGESAQAQQPEQPGARISGRAATEALLEQAAYWRQQNQPERALQALERVLAVEPEHLEALSAAVEAASQAGNTAAAQRHLAALRRLAPDDERSRRAEAQFQLLTQDWQTLTAARQLAAAGRQAEAVQRYRLLARDGSVPAVIAAEYYQVLAAASEAGYREAVAELRRRIAATPGDARLALTLAQLLTYREDTRSDGIDRLQALARRPGMREAVRDPWRIALIWSGEDPETAARIDAYFEAFPGTDPELEGKRRRSREGGLTPNQQARALAWVEVDARRYTAAEREFARALELDPADAESLIGLAIIRKIQNRFPEARAFYARAVAAAPDREAEFQRAVGDLSGREAAAGGFLLPASALAWRAFGRGDLAQAERLARQAARGRGEERLQGELILGQIALQQSDFATAEQRFRAALALRPRQPDALRGLYLALDGQGRFAEADSLQREAGFSLPPGAAAVRAASLAQVARRLDHPEQVLEQLRAALRLDPGNPWVTLDLVRRLKSRGEIEEARRLERGLEGRSDAEASMAAALLALDDERFGDAVALFQRVPARLLGADMARLAAAARREFEVRQLEDQARANRVGARAMLERMAGQRDPSGTMGPAVVRALGRLEEAERAENAARLALSANPDAPVAARLQLAAALVEARRPEAARGILETLARDPRLTADQRRELESVEDYAAGTRTGQLLLEDRRLAARQEIEALAARQQAREPGAPGSVVLARLLIAQGNARAARTMLEEILERAPRDIEAREALVDAAIAERDWARARAVLVEGAFLHPQDLRMILAEARLRRALGDQAGTLRLMERAAARRLTELRADGEVAGAAARSMGAGATAGQAQRLHDPLTAQIAQELIRAREDASMWLQAGAHLHARGGVAGISRMTNITLPAEVSVPAPEIGGRLIVGVDTVLLRAGRMGSDFNTTQSFGTNPVFADPSFARPAFVRPIPEMDGAAVRVTYLRPNLRAEIGTTPLGFERPTWTGVFELVPQLTERLRVRLTAERAPITDSMLSYAGYRQVLSGPFWGGVTRTGGRIQFEYSPDSRSGIYAGGGVHALEGSNVVRNTRYEAGVGGFYAVLRQPGQSVTIGVDLRYTGHDRNAGGFTFGHGGYFSPSQSVVASLIGEYRAQWGDWTFRGIGAVGYQNFRTASAPVFPTNPFYQAQIEAQAAAAPEVFRARLAGTRSSGPTGSLFANLEYAATPNLRLGVAGRYERVGNYEDTAGFFYLRYRFDRPAPELRPLHDAFPAPTVYPNVNDPQPGAFIGGAPELVRLPQGATRPVW